MKSRSYFAKKEVAALLRDAPPEGGGTLTAFDLTLLGIGCIMGTGVFVLTGRAAALYAGPAVTLSFLIAALAASLAAMCYAELASMLPVAGSGYTYAYATMGELPAFFMGWVLALQYLIGAACVAVGWSGYAHAIWKSLALPALPNEVVQAPWTYLPGTGLAATGAWVNAPAVAIVIGVCAVLSGGIEASAKVNAAVVSIKVVVVVAFLFFAAPHVDPANWRPFVPPEGPHGTFGPYGVVRAATMLFFAYLGFDAVSVAATETRTPRRDVPIGILASLAICAAIYVAVALVLTGVVPYGRLDVASPLAVGVEVVGWPALSLLVDVGALAGLTSVLLVQLLAQPRVLQTMAADGLLPPFLATVHPRTRVPLRLTWLSGAVCAAAAGLLPIDVLADLTSEGTLLAFLLVGLGVLLLRRSQPRLQRRFRVPGGTYPVPVLCMGMAFGLMVIAWRTLPGLGLWLALGALLYFAEARPRLASK